MNGITPMKESKKSKPNSNCENIAKRNIAKNNKEDKNKRIGSICKGI